MTIVRVAPHVRGGRAVRGYEYTLLVPRKKGGRSDRVPVAPLAEAVAAMVARPGVERYGRDGAPVDSTSKLTYTHLSYEVWGGRKDDPKKGDVSRLKRALGLKPRTPASAGPPVATTIGVDLAARIARAAGLDPVDVGV